MKSNLQQVSSGEVMLMFLSSGFMQQINIILETLLLQNFRLVSKRDAQLQSQLEENKVKDRESKREQKEKLKWYHNLFLSELSISHNITFYAKLFYMFKNFLQLSM